MVKAQPTAEDRLKAIGELVGMLDIARLREIVETVHSLEALKSQAKALDADNQDKRGERDRLLGEIAAQSSIRDSFSALAHAAQLTAQEALESVRALRASLQAEVSGLQQQAEKLRSEVGDLSRTKATLSAEVDQLETRRDGLAAETTVLEREVVHLKADAEGLVAQRSDAQARVEATRRLAENEQSRYDALSEEDQRLQARCRDLREQVSIASAEIRHLTESYRPLLPYLPPADAPRGWIEKEDPVGSTLPVLDRRALDVYCRAGTGKGKYKKTALADALRNYLPHDAYRVAIGELTAEAAIAAQPAPPI